MSSKSQKQQSRMRKSDSTGKTAYLTVGRWQPPHKGHAVLIQKTLQLAQDNDGHAYVFICSK
jgi:nicotinamide mononucleotide adenylyltransferase